ncbi:hypothetical protein Tco_0447529, partial [Tanacetum coccineum]
MNYIPVSLENQANPHAGASEVTNSAGTSQTPYSNASEEKDEDVELIVVPSTVKKLEGILKRRNVVLSDSEEEEPEAQRRKSQDDPLVSLVQGLVTPSMTNVNASGEEQVEDISPNTLEA